jgi:Holliday junction DNA helicase RuvA
VHTPDVVRRAIASGDTSTLTRVPGIGKKGAERLVLELRDKIGPIGGDGASLVGLGAGAPWAEQVRQALIGLGWTQSQADQAVAAVAEQLDGGTVPAVPILLKQAIRMLGSLR